MKVLRLKLYQETACYKKPFAFKVGETYPLPPYSTVKGMLHALLDARKFIPMRLSVQGDYDTIVVDYQTHYFFKKADVDEFPLVLDGLPVAPKHESMTKMPIYTHLLYDVNLIIHVEAEDDVIDQIIQRLESGDYHLSLGRWEDLVRIDGYRVVDVKELDDEVYMQHSAYISKVVLENETPNLPYRLNWKYEIINGVRQWEKIKVGYVQKGIPLSEEEAMADTDGNLVFFHLP